MGNRGCLVVLALPALSNQTASNMNHNERRLARYCACLLSPRHMMRVAALLLFVCIAHLQVASSDDAAALRSLMYQWKNTPPSWDRSTDPCGTRWEGVGCNNSRVTTLILFAMGIKGTLSGDIGQLSELQHIDLSSNNELGGPLVPDIGNLKKLTTLNLINCSFSGDIPNELGNLTQLSILTLTSNKFTGTIPASLGCLSNLYLLDLADNQLTGTLPISTKKGCGLDQLINTRHFHFNKNRLSGPIPENLFSSQMTLIHILFDGNQFTGRIPDSIGLVQTLEVLRLDRNSFSGPVPSNLNNLTRITELNLANNMLTGPMPDLTGMNSLNYVDLSNNTFDPSETPAWFSKIQSLTALMIESGRLHGQVPQQLFGFPQLQQVKLKNNAFNGSLNMGDSISEQLQMVDFQNNNLTGATITSVYKKSLILVGNPVCNARLSNTVFCRLHQPPGSTPFSTSPAICITKSCPPDQSPRPQSCDCACPYEGVFVFRAPLFVDLTNDMIFHSLEESLRMNLDLSPHSVLLQNPFFDSDSYLQVQLKIFPSAGMYFNVSEVLRIGFNLSSLIYSPPPMFGTYYFVASPYPFPGRGGASSMATRMICGIAVGCAVLALGLLALGIYALRQKQKAKQALELSSPFVSWVESVRGSGSAPQLKGARWFSYEELKKSTNNFSEMNEVGSGGYGKVYRGMISNGQIVAIKRARQGSMQGGLEFKTEIELLSRVHHKNLVSLVGFCFEQGELILVYEFMPNGTLRDSLSGRSGIQLDWKQRLEIAVGSARGLAYLHELADPPIIHRDVKSTNILLDENLTAKVADFGLSKLVSDSEKGHVSTQVKGTLGYLDPEYYMTQQLTEKSDVYSFGVVMFELITARPPLKKGRYIVREVKMAMDKNVEHYGLKKMIDPIIQNTSYLIGFGTFVELAIRCVEESAENRPPMSDVVKEIETILHNARLSTDFGNAKGAPHHPYNDSLPRKDVDSSGFEYSGGYSFSGKLEPK